MLQVLPDEATSTRTSIFRKFCHVIPPQPDALFALRCIGSLRYDVVIGHTGATISTVSRSLRNHRI